MYQNDMDAPDILVEKGTSLPYGHLEPSWGILSLVIKANNAVCPEVDLIW